MCGVTLASQFALIASAQEASKDDWTLRILHTNDTHGHLESVARLSTVINEARKEHPNSVLLSAGDVFDGTPYFKQYRGLADLKFMNLLGYDVMTIGNHELYVEDLANFVKGAQFPILNANYDFSKEPLLAPLLHESIEDSKKASGEIHPAVVMHVKGEQVGVVGLTTGEDIELEDHMQLYDLYSTTRKTIAKLATQGVNKIIVLSHLGYYVDLELAKNVKGIDVIVGGHTHTQLEHPVIVKRDQDEAPTLVVQTGQYGEFLGSLDATFDKNGVVTRWNGRLVPVNEQDDNENFRVADDPKVKAVLDELTAPLEDMKKSIVGKSAVELNGERFAVRSKETNMGNLITDSMLSKASEKTDASLALISGGNIRASIPAGTITLSDVTTTMPFEHNLFTLQLTGKQVIQALENGVSEVEKKTGKFPQVAGMKYVWDPAGQPFKRIVSVEVKTARGYEPIQTEAIYTLATVKYLADGGDGYVVFKQAQDAGLMRNIGDVDYDILIAYMQRIGEISPQVEGRITEGRVTEELNQPRFIDMQGHWARKEIEFLADRQIVTGSSEGRFVPDEKITRAQISVMLAKALSLTSSAEGLPFRDVTADAWYTNAINQVYLADLLTGRDEVTFSPNESITREELAGIAMNAYGYITGKRLADLTMWSTDVFADEQEINALAKASVQQAVGLGMLQRGDDGMFRPSEEVTRAQASIVIQRLLSVKP
ncbi:5'-nucleotidase C-terminal domain-containing protein [Paenibacillus pectinilyticus]|nr:5'-nucleotidase C-terminal domain-containing protein [Paenibacillus pectinilyticus]